MTLYEYKMLSEDEQYDTVFSKGKFLDIVIEGNSKFVLYAIDKFIVEDYQLLRTLITILFCFHKNEKLYKKEE